MYQFYPLTLDIAHLFSCDGGLVQDDILAVPHDAAKYVPWLNRRYRSVIIQNLHYYTKISYRMTDPFLVYLNPLKTNWFTCLQQKIFQS